MDVSPQPTTKIRDIRAKRLRLKVLKQFIPEWEQSLVNAIHERASLEAIIIKVEAHELAKNHDGLCGRTREEVQLERDQAANEEVTGPYFFAKGDRHQKCERFYGHTGLHSWEGGGIG